ncbi:PKD domain-containing protein [Pseudoalteromonas sp. T1lg65]|uniref:PKD domain-containing protein n=1 Tax=Pseudoalteromonas sp. T1lg65 TaxID=2077101 RepID=UPI003F79119F
MKAITLIAAVVFTIGLTACGGDSYSTGLPVIDTENVQQPVARIAPVTTAKVGKKLTLDATSSLIPKGASYQWQWLQKPEASKSELSDPKSLQPTFTVDVEGEYELQFIIDSDDKRSVTRTRFSTLTDKANQKPVARFNYKFDNFYPDEVATFDASGSSDPDGDRLTFQWIVNAPTENAEFTVSDENKAKISFKATTLGKYKVSVLVSDGVDTEVFSANIDVTNTPLKPVISLPAAVKVGDVVHISAADSTMYKGTTILWFLNRGPKESETELTSNSTLETSFTPDVAGEYSVQLMLIGDKDKSSTIELITVVAEGDNAVPTANIVNAPKRGLTYQEIILDGSTSHDPDGDQLSYQWQVSEPAGTKYTLTTTQDPQATFVAEDVGRYLISLTVSDGESSNTKVHVFHAVTANTPPSASFVVKKPAINQGKRVVLEANSKDAEQSESQLEHHWQITKKPAHSSATIAALNYYEAELIFDFGGSYEITLVTSDGHLTSKPFVKAMTLRRPNNQAPVISSVNVDDNPKVNKPILLEAIATDPNEDPLVFNWSVEDDLGAKVEFSRPNYQSTEFTVSKAGSYLVTVTANDGELTTVKQVSTLITVTE